MIYIFFLGVTSMKRCHLPFFWPKRRSTLSNNRSGNGPGVLWWKISLRVRWTCCKRCCGKCAKKQGFNLPGVPEFRAVLVVFWRVDGGGDGTELVTSYVLMISMISDTNLLVTNGLLDPGCCWSEGFHENPMIHFCRMHPSCLWICTNTRVDGSPILV